MIRHLYAALSHKSQFPPLRYSKWMTSTLINGKMEAEWAFFSGVHGVIKERYLSRHSHTISILVTMRIFSATR